MTTHEVFVGARNLLDREGWCQGALKMPDGSRCALGAMVAASWGQDDGYVKSWEILTDAVGSIPAWNNHPDRTKEEVLAAFDKAIAATAPEPADPLSGVLSPLATNPAPRVGLDHEGPQKPAQEPVGA